MGTLRFLLAAAVVVFHVTMFAPLEAGWIRGLPLSPFPAAAAVEAFFILSGFAISGAIATKYRTATSFYAGRVRRLFPAYLAVLALEILGALYVWDMPGFHRAWLAGDWSAAELLLWAWTNLAILGKEAWQFTDRAGFEFVSPAWSLSLELQFYLLAPLLMRLRTEALFALLLAAVVVRTKMNLIVPYEPLIYYSLPGQFCMFLVGMVAYRLKWQPFGRWAPAACVLLCIATVAYPQGTAIARVDGWKMGYFAALFVLLPAFTHSNRLDGYLGSLSYTLYLCHLPVIYLLLALVPGGLGSSSVFIVLVLAIAAAAAVHGLVEVPLRRRPTGARAGSSARSRPSAEQSRGLAGSSL